MNKQICLLLFIIWFSINAFSQDSEFEWKNWPSFGNSYTIEIKNINSNCIIQIKDSWKKDSICTKMSKIDCDSLILFLSKYSFKTKGNCFTYGNVGKEYQKTRTLKDKDWIILNGDSVRLIGALSLGLKFDKEANKYYYETISHNCITDGTTYEGRFQMNNQIKNFSIHSGRISDEDYRLNMIMFNLIRTYSTEKNYSILLKDIERDKPVRKDYQ
jgi:hypothetical protein